ncbi:MAG: DUF4595 domain-containing protein [Bacteroidales bacterium]|jgi:hypothetical protein|nr:DUF4595 domain-containing protein [Bacteroidales bacterium]
MKKIMLFAALAGCMVLLTSCGDNKEEKKIKAQIATFDDQWEGYFTYTFNDDGKPTQIVRRGDGEATSPVSATYDFAYDGTTLIITVTKTGEDPYQWAEIHFGANGYASSFKDEWLETYNYVYNADGNITSCDRDGGERGTATYSDGDLTAFTRPADDGWEPKNHTYTADLNTENIYNIYFERIGVPRWLVETGLFGKPTKHLCATSKWQTSEITSTHTYALNSQNRIMRETKMYGDEPEVYEYTWKEVEVK